MNAASLPSGGLYLLTPDDPDTDRLLRRVEQGLRGGARLLQYRNKTAPPALRRAQALALKRLCDDAGVPLIVNDDVALAEAVGAAGVHLGAEDGGIAAARARLGESAIVGASCYADPARARAAAEAGASYLAFGAFHSSGTKPLAVRAEPAILAACAGLGLPRVAIGGITPDNARPLVEAGADFLAVIDGVFGAPDPTAAARAISALFPPPARG
ncbi:thiamine phosphate synthase [Coralloluteibacterium thermophilus]|uniref:Thiamine-phosphate synthase n=1 Tax=Coralloluteibacterium thermophilum TaxID=2707049 RepID=A0ABV9NH94_9GAMM